MPPPAAGNRWAQHGPHPAVLSSPGGGTRPHSSSSWECQGDPPWDGDAAGSAPTPHQKQLVLLQSCWCWGKHVHLPPIPLHPTHPSLLIHPSLGHPRALPRPCRAEGAQGAPLWQRGWEEDATNGGCYKWGMLLSIPAPSQPSSPRSREQPQLPAMPPAPQHLPGPGCAPSLRDRAGHMAGAAPALLTRIRAMEGGREQLGCHGGEEAAEGETFPGREESVGDAGRGCPAPRGRAGGGNISEHLCTVWRWRGHICLWIDGAGGKKEGNLLPSPSLWMLSCRALLPQPQLCSKPELGCAQQPPLGCTSPGCPLGTSSRCCWAWSCLPSRLRWLMLLRADNPINPPLLPPTLRLNKLAQEKRGDRRGLRS